MLAMLSYGHFATDLSQGVVPALLPVFRNQYHLSYTDVGLIVLLANMSSSVVQPAFGVLSDRINQRLLMPMGALLASVGIALSVFANSYAIMVSMVFVSGLGVAAFHPEGYKFAGLASGIKRATGMSYFSVGGNLGFGLGPAIASVAFALFGAKGMGFVVLVSIPAAVMLWRLSAPKERRRLEEEWRAVGAPGRRRASASGAIPRGAMIIIGLLIVFVILRSWVQSGEANLIPLFFTGVRHTDLNYAGVLASVFLASGAAGTLIGGPVADRWGYRPVLIMSTAVMPPLLWLLPRAEGMWVFVIAIAAGMAVVSTFAVVMVMAQVLIPERIGLISGLVIGFAVGTGGIGVTALGAIADHWGLARALDLVAVLPLAGVAIALILPHELRSARNLSPEPHRTSVGTIDPEVGGGP